jgi:hypothetical protein
VEADGMSITIDTWLYGDIARFGGDANQRIFANLKLKLADGSTISDLLSALKMPTEARGITFINGNLSALPGVQPDLDHVLKDADRVAFFHLRSMWPYQYRHGAAMIAELSTTLESRPDRGVHHAIK